MRRLRKTIFAAIATAVNGLADPLGRVVAIAVIVAVAALVVTIFAMTGWRPWPDQDIGTRADIAALLLAFFAVSGIVLTLIAGGFETLFLSEGQDTIHKFGAVILRRPASSDVYEHGDIEPVYPFPNHAVHLEVRSDDPRDAAGAPGAHIVSIFGLDESYRLVYCDVVMRGSEPALTEQSFLRVNRAFVKGVGAHGTNVGTITVRSVDTGDALATIGAGHGQTLQCVYTIPADHTLLLRSWMITVSPATVVTSTLFHRELGGAWRIRDRHFSDAAGPLVHEYPSDVPMVFSGGSDIRVHVEAASPVSISAEFTGIQRPAKGWITEAMWD